MVKTFTQANSCSKDQVQNNCHVKAAVVMKTQLPHSLGNFGYNVQFFHNESMCSLGEVDQQASLHN